MRIRWPWARNGQRLVVVPRIVVNEMTAVTQEVLPLRVMDEEWEKEWGVTGPFPEAWSNDEESGAYTVLPGVPS